jgi:chemotaxis protein CheD
MNPYSTFIHAGEIEIDRAPASIVTILGSCVSVCLYDKKHHIGGMNHYLLPTWHAQGSEAFKYGNIAIPTLIEIMLDRGSNIRTLEAKVFGGASVDMNYDRMMIGQQNIDIAKEILDQYKIMIVAQDVGGEHARRIQFNLKCGKVKMFYAPHTKDIQRG